MGHSKPPVIKINTDFTNLSVPSSAKNQLVIIVTGPHGGGKHEIMKALVGDSNLKVERLVRTTTRRKGNDEENGLEYHFVDEAQFQYLLENHELVEHFRHAPGFYGTTRAAVIDVIDKGKNIVIDVEIEPAYVFIDFFKALNIPYIDIFIGPVPKEKLQTPEQIEEAIQKLQNRMKTRGHGETSEQLLAREIIARKWLSEDYQNFTYYVANEDNKLDRALEEAKNIVRRALKEF